MDKNRAWKKERSVIKANWSDDAILFTLLFLCLFSFCNIVRSDISFQSCTAMTTMRLNLQQSLA